MLTDPNEIQRQIQRQIDENTTALEARKAQLRKEIDDLNLYVDDYKDKIARLRGYVSVSPAQKTVIDNAIANYEELMKRYDQMIITAKELLSE